MNEDVETREDQTEEDEATRDDRPRPTGATLRDRLDARRVEPEPEDANTRTSEPKRAESRANLFEEGRASDLRTRWTDVQSRFVDDPRAAVKSADALVKEVVEDLSRQFADERAKLEGQWGRDEKVSTEDLRVALRRYREFFERLLSV